jgi:putative transposase
MPRRKHSPERILGKLREVEIALAQGETVARAVKQIAVTEQTYYRWRNEYGALSIDQARKLKKLELESCRITAKQKDGSVPALAG